MADDFEKFDEPQSADHVAMAQLEKQLSRAIDGRREERFVWIVITVILFDIMLLANTPNLALPIVVLILQLIVFGIIAKRLGIDYIVVLVNRLLHNVRPPTDWPDGN